MSTYTNELKSSHVMRLTGDDESKALSLTINCGKNRAHIESVERADTSLLHAAISVGTNAVNLYAGGSGLTNRRNISVRNWGNRTIYIGDGTGTNTVTISTGFPLKAGESITLPVSENLTVKAITDTGTVDTRILEVS
jgi:hypothetical protein